MSEALPRDPRRERMVTELGARGITDRAVLDALRAIPRERFVDQALERSAYEDTALPIGDKQTISQPWIVARMSELAEPARGGRALEIGTGSGYQAAVLSRLFDQVYTVERLAALSRSARELVRGLGIENVHFKIFDGSYGWSEFAPYQAIVVTAVSRDVPTPLYDQLEEGGRLVLPLAQAPGSDEQTLIRVIKRGGRPLREEHGSCRFVPLVGRFGWDA
jgi:protein-L-isoaspartate(D-aspartate) O-methyltransferase